MQIYHVVDDLQGYAGLSKLRSGYAACFGRRSNSVRIWENGTSTLPLLSFVTSPISIKAWTSRCTDFTSLSSARANFSVGQAGVYSLDRHRKVFGETRHDRIDCNTAR